MSSVVARRQLTYPFDELVDCQVPLGSVAVFATRNAVTLRISDFVVPSVDPVVFENDIASGGGHRSDRIAVVARACYKMDGIIVGYRPFESSFAGIFLIVPKRRVLRTETRFLCESLNLKFSCQAPATLRTAASKVRCSDFTCATAVANARVSPHSVAAGQYLAPRHTAYRPASVSASNLEVLHMKVD